MKILATLVLTTLSLSVLAQETSQLVGNWKYKQIHEQEQYDADIIALANKSFRTTSLQFFADNNYKAFITGLGKNQGTWELKKASIYLKSDVGTVPLEVLAVSQDELIVTYGQSSLVMSRATDEEIKALTEKKAPYKTVAISESQASKKWFLLKRESLTNPENDSQLAMELIKGSYLDLSKIGKYEVSILGMNEKGKWELGENSQAIITLKGKNRKQWDVLKVTDTELELIQGPEDKKWIFSTEEPK